MIARASARRLEAARQLEMAAAHGSATDPHAGAPANSGWGSPALSMIVTMVIGVAFALLVRSRWVSYGVAASSIFAVLHIVTRSRQYQQYLAQAQLRTAGPRPYDVAFFFLAKAAFSFLEIAIAVMLVSLIRQLVA
jgi:hypothetical protein